MKLFKQITVDLYNPFPLKKLSAQQNNIGRGVIVTLTAGSEIVDSSEEDVKLWAKRPDGNVSYLPCTVQADGTIKAPFSSQMLSVTGNIIVSLEMISGEDDITTPIFIVENNVNISDNNSAESTNEFTALQQAVSQMNTAMQEVEILKKEGLKGDPGIAATVRVGNVSASEPGGNPEITNSGTENNAILDFVLPRGIQGPKGETPDTVDPMLATEIGFPADAKLTGDAIREQNKNLTQLTNRVLIDINSNEVIAKGGSKSHTLNGTIERGAYRIVFAGHNVKVWHYIGYLFVSDNWDVLTYKASNIDVTMSVDFSTVTISNTSPTYDMTCYTLSIIKI